MPTPFKKQAIMEHVLRDSKKGTARRSCRVIYQMVATIPRVKTSMIPMRSCVAEADSEYELFFLECAPWACQPETLRKIISKAPSFSSTLEHNEKIHEWV